LHHIFIRCFCECEVILWDHITLEKMIKSHSRACKIADKISLLQNLSSLFWYKLNKSAIKRNENQSACLQKLVPRFMHKGKNVSWKFPVDGAEQAVQPGLLFVVRSTQSCFAGTWSSITTSCSPLIRALRCPLQAGPSELLDAYMHYVYIKRLYIYINNIYIIFYNNSIRWEIISL
jgi:hypothetical protein